MANKTEEVGIKQFNYLDSSQLTGSYQAIVLDPADEEDPSRSVLRFCVMGMGVTPAEYSAYCQGEILKNLIKIADALTAPQQEAPQGLDCSKCGRDRLRYCTCPKAG